MADLGCQQVRQGDPGVSARGKHLLESGKPKPHGDAERAQELTDRACFCSSQFLKTGSPHSGAQDRFTAVIL